MITGILIWNIIGSLLSAQLGFMSAQIYDSRNKIGEDSATF
jgi:hypothetical protein